MKNISLFPRYMKSQDNQDIFILTNAPLEEIKKGERPLLVFNYGLVCNINHWEKQIPYFHQRNFHILLHDYRGHFNSMSDQGLEFCNFSQMADDLYRHLEDLNHQNVFMVGHSMGVNVTLNFAHKYPQRLKGLVLISGTIQPPHQVMFDSQIMNTVFPFSEALSKKFPHFFRFLWDISSDLPLVQQGILKGGFNPNQVTLEFVVDYLKKIKALSPELFFYLIKQMKEDDIKNKIDEIKTPCLIISGDKDKVIPIHTQYELKQKLKNSELYIIKEGSHVPQVDFGDEINKRMKLFFKKHLVEHQSKPNQQS